MTYSPVVNHVADCEVWRRVRAEVKGRKARRKEFRLFQAEIARQELALLTRWYPKAKGVG